MRIQSVDVGHTSAYYAKACLMRGDTEVVVVPYMGADSVKPFTDAGISVSAIGCIERIVGSHNACADVQARLAQWPGVSVMDCDATAAAIADCPDCNVGSETQCA